VHEAELLAGVRASVPTGFWSIDGERTRVERPAPGPGEDIPGDIWPPRSQAAPVAGTGDGRPFAGMSVLDLGVAGAAPELGRLLAEYGAQVVRLDDPAHPEVFRMMGGESGIGHMFASSNRSKESLAVRLADRRGAALVRELARRVDVVIENLAPGALQRLGLDLDSMRRANPRLITLSTPMLAPGGPWSEWRGYGANAQSVGGLTATWSVPSERGPAGIMGAFPDHVAGRLGAVAVVACEIARRRTGQGATIAMAQAEVPLNLLAELVAKESLDPGSVSPPANCSEQFAPWGVYSCRGEERWIVVSCRSDQDWQGLRRAMGDPAWAQAAHFASMAGRVAARTELDELLNQWTSAQGNRELMELLQCHLVPAGMVMYLADLVVDPHFTARGYPIRLDQPGLGQVTLEGPGFRATRMAGPRSAPAPFTGQHSRKILRQFLAMPDAEIDALVGAGIVADDARDGDS
jgi:crotonobetainyl-CoA:carnitine CoA-transferase CaiB-like acyl-CoA transferase